MAYIKGTGKQVIRAVGNRIEVVWVNVSGARYTTDAECGQTDSTSGVNPQCGVGILGAGVTYPADGTGFKDSLFVQYTEVYGNANVGVGGQTGVIARSDIHDNANNGVWCDAGCYDPDVPLGQGFYVHDNVVVDNVHNGVRYENSPKPGEPTTYTPKALIQYNDIHGDDVNSGSGHNGGVVINSAQNATVDSNMFGAVNGYTANKRAFEFSEGTDSDRSKLLNDRATNNKLNQEPTVGCELPDDKVYCDNNL